MLSDMPRSARPGLGQPTVTARTPTSSLAPAEHPGPTDVIDTSFLESLLGYNARRTALTVISVFLRRMEPYGLRPVDFSVLTLVAHNPGITSRQICGALDILPPNLVGIVKGFERRGLLERRPHPTDRRAHGLHLTAAGTALQAEAQQTASDLEKDAASRLSATEQKTLIRLLRKIYLPS